ncbi:MAG TPA: hypothetical protein VGQ24_13405 [Gemmatimonadales bacterium]|jgi:hypothetical protein|nr:hypothetical protein [Gemmatimonadales bacterium]
MPTQIFTTMPILHENIPVGTDFVGGAKPLPLQPAGPANVTPGSDFAGGAVPLTSEIHQGETEQQ